MRRETTSSTLTLAILGLTSFGPLSGYDLRKIFRTTPMGHFSTSPGAVYPALERMEKRGLLRGRIQKEMTLRPKKTYVITEEGKRALTKRLSGRISHDEVVWRMDELMLRFAFMGHVLGTEDCLRFLRELATLVDPYVLSLRKHVALQKKSNRVTGAYALEHGVMHYEATAKWARRVVRELESKKRRDK